MSKLTDEGLESGWDADVDEQGGAPSSARGAPSGGGGSPGLITYLRSREAEQKRQEMLTESLKEMLDRLDDPCSHALGFDNSDPAIKRFNEVKGNIKFADKGMMSFKMNNGTWVGQSGEFGHWNPVTQTITLNMRINWEDPNNSEAIFDGQVKEYRALDASSYQLGRDIGTAQDFLTFQLFHEFAHAAGKGKAFDPDKIEVERTIWDTCMRRL
jgi:hypothetical protein